jgi:HSP20 family molecular chaperone IbpA
MRLIDAVCAGAQPRMFPQEVNHPMGFGSRDPSDWMFGEALELLRRAEQLQSQFFRFGSSAGARWEPPVDVYERDGEFRILVALPGVDPNHVEVLVENGTLVIHGARPLPQESQAATIRRLEIPHGRFERRIAMPPGEYRLSAKHLENGCLLVRLARVERKEIR